MACLACSHVESRLWKRRQRFGLSPPASTSIVTYLSFPGTTREAMTFYQEVFGGELTVNTFGEFQAVPEGDPATDKVMHANLQSDSFRIMASDYDERFIGGVPYSVGQHASTSVVLDDAEDGRRIFDALADGGNVEMPYDKQVWGDHYGSVTDKFGQPWMVNAG